MKTNKGMSFVSLVIAIVALMLLAGVSLSLLMYDKELNQDNSNKNEQVHNQNQQEECKHDWVITSKYDIFTNSYRTISKCSKCGKEIE